MIFNRIMKSIRRIDRGFSEHNWRAKLLLSRPAHPIAMLQPTRRNVAKFILPPTLFDLFFPCDKDDLSKLLEYHTLISCPMVSRLLQEMQLCRVWRSFAGSETALLPVTIKRNKTMVKKSIFVCLSIAAVTAQADLVAHWDFEGDAQEHISSTTGTLTGDAAVSGAAVAPNSTTSLSVSAGRLETGMNAGDIAGFGGTGSFTILCWVKTTTTSEGAYFAYSPTGGNNAGADIRLYVRGDGRFRIAMNSGASDNDIGAAGLLNDGTTHLVAAVFNSATGDSFRDIDIYIDGTFYDVDSGTDHPIDIATGDQISIGDGTRGADPNYIGLLDDVAIYDTALTLSELNDIAAYGVLGEAKKSVSLIILQ